MRWVLWFCFLACAAISFAGPKRIGSATALFDSLRAGESVRLVADYSRCKLILDGKETEAPKAIGGMKLDHWEWFDKGVVRNDLAYVASSETVLIAHPRYGHVYNYVRVRIYSDNTVEITARYLKTSDLAIVMDETFKGKISNGKDAEGISLFISG